ncbi:MAG: hypothetical protein CMK59_11280 [Proteobacteria bacterium]|nr:hypothetical protein [Pseudomonadota bacterium]|tara:strand:- start:126 stop:725 length:600 start_codon:yes stop_codon:yes gene_type:complete
MKVLKTRNDGIEIIKLESTDDLQPYLTSFTEAYLDIFSGAPYFELFYTHEAQQILETNIQAEDHITLLALDKASNQGDKVIGIGFAVPLRARPDVGRQLRGLIPIDHTFYLAELGIRPEYRRRGLGRELTLMRLEHISPDRFNHVVLRTSIEQDASQKMYAHLGFSDMGVYSEVTSRKLDGNIKTDHRLFLSRLIQTPH